MEVVRITPRGYCHGVVKAMNIAKQTGKSAEGPVFAIGQLVHNHHVLEDLAQHGVTVLDGPDRLTILEQVEDGTVIFSAHGVSPRVRQRAEEKGLRWVDATCPDVIRTHELARDLVSRGYFIIYIGKHGHPEPEGVIGNAPDRMVLIETQEEALALDLHEEKLAVLTQTTLSVWDTEELIDLLRRRYPQIEVYNEICRATQERQEAAVAAAREVDLVIVVGDRRSSNSNRLVEV
ncbi:MAG TPA: 4-hydroxy-3-methylbut-2-enyl diphosphate reductase, partial [Chloroflexota bacterium]